MPSLIDISHIISSNPAPVIFMDTCIYLDIIRVIFRGNIDIGNIEAAREILAACADNKVYLLCASLSNREYNNNVSNVLNEADAHISNSFTPVSSLVLKSSTILSAQLNLSTLTEFKKMDHEVEILSRALLAASISVEPDNICYQKSAIRNERLIAPSRKGKSGNDCLVLEVAEKCCDTLRNNGFTEKYLFLTSNTKDFGTPTSLFAPIDAEFITYNITSAYDLKHAAGILGL